MKLSRLFVANAVINAVYGLAFVALPVQLLELYGITLNAGAALVARLFGAALVGIGLILWRMRSSPREVGQLVVLPLFIADSIGFVAYLRVGVPLTLLCTAAGLGMLAQRGCA